MIDENRELLLRCARALDDLREDLVFVGGCTTGLLITDPAAADVRSTRDVDVIAEVGSLVEYYALEKRIRSLGFHEDPDVRCRWQRAGITLDVMPTDPKILGFSNPWYPGAIKYATVHTLAPKLFIRVVTPPYFCATKIVAFHGRGHQDYAASHDLEDFLTVVDGRSELASEIRLAEPNVRRYIAAEVSGFLRDGRFIDALPGCLQPDSASQARLPLLAQRLHEIASIE
jgi:hypothetical protein